MAILQRELTLSPDRTIYELHNTSSSDTVIINKILPDNKTYHGKEIIIRLLTDTGNPILLSSNTINSVNSNIILETKRSPHPLATPTKEIICDSSVNNNVLPRTGYFLIHDNNPSNFGTSTNSTVWSGVLSNQYSGKIRFSFACRMSTTVAPSNYHTTRFKAYYNDGNTTITASQVTASILSGSDYRSVKLQGVIDYVKNGTLEIATELVTGSTGTGRVDNCDLIILSSEITGDGQGYSKNGFDESEYYGREAMVKLMWFADIQKWVEISRVIYQ